MQACKCISAAARKYEAQYKHGLSAEYRTARNQQRQYIRQIISQWRIVIKDGIAVAIIEIRCPAWIKFERPQRVAQFGGSEDMKLGISFAGQGCSEQKRPGCRQ